MATLHAKGKLPLHQDFLHEGILDTIFTGRLIGETRVGTLLSRDPYPQWSGMDY
jgi:proline racemase